MQQKSLNMQQLMFGRTYMNDSLQNSPNTEMQIHPRALMYATTFPPAKKLLIVPSSLETLLHSEEIYMAECSVKHEENYILSGKPPQRTMTVVRDINS